MVMDRAHVAAELDALLPGVRRLASSAFYSVYELMADSLNTFAYGYLRDRGAAEDAVQQAFLELVKAAGDIRGNGRSLRAWLYRSVRFTCLDELRRRSRRPETPIAQLPEPPVEDHLDLGLDSDLEAALGQLTPRQRSIVYLRHVEGMSGAEVGEVLGINRAAAFAAGSRAERRLRSLLEVES